MENKYVKIDKKSLEIEELMVNGDGFEVPLLMLTPTTSKGGVIVAHNYGGSKEEMLGIALRIAKTGFTTGVIDLRGHGENGLPLNEEILLDLETTRNYYNILQTVWQGNSGGTFARWKISIDK